MGGMRGREGGRWEKEVSRGDLAAGAERLGGSLARDRAVTRARDRGTPIARNEPRHLWIDRIDAAPRRARSRARGRELDPNARGKAESARTANMALWSAGVSRVSAAGPATRRKPEKVGRAVEDATATAWVATTAMVVARTGT